MKSKEELLGYGIFINNEYFDKYIELVNNKCIKYIKGKTNSHHIIPKYFYRNNNEKIDNSKENIVNLLYKDHILAHYYLAMCSLSQEDVSRNVLSIRFILNGKDLYSLNIDEIDFDKYQKMYEESRKAFIDNSHTEEINKRISEKLIGRDSPNKGNIKSTHKIPKINHFVKNKKLSDNAKLRTGKDNPFYGKKHTEETKKLIRKKNGKPVAMVNLLTNEVIKTFESAHEASKYLIDNNFSKSIASVNRILAVCHKNSNMYKAYGFNWRFVNKV